MPGPGAVGGCFVHERHARNFKLPRFAGWWGHDKAKRFLYDPEFDPIAGAQGWQISNPPILSMAPLLASLEIFQRAGILRLREKSIALTGYHAASHRGAPAGSGRDHHPARAGAARLSIEPAHWRAPPRKPSAAMSSSRRPA